VYCRVRPFLPGQDKKSTTIDYMGENGELLITNQFKQGKDGHRMFKFNKVFNPFASQGMFSSDFKLVGYFLLVREKSCHFDCL